MQSFLLGLEKGTNTKPSSVLVKPLWIWRLNFMGNTMFVKDLITEFRSLYLELLTLSKVAIDDTTRHTLVFKAADNLDNSVLNSLGFAIEYVQDEEKTLTENVVAYRELLKEVNEKLMEVLALI
ncbi:MAG TPA: hypothetical protein PLP33_14725 [Leptospiraceae bacterium]|nr:hypothetical protein [Leptospiraceae bacterium]